MATLIATVRVPGLSIARSLTALLAFLMGAVFGGRIMVRSGDDLPMRLAVETFVLECLFLLAASLCAIGYSRDMMAHSFQPFILIALTALAMGTRTATIRKLAIPDLTTTVLTMIVTGMAADSSLARGHNPGLSRRQTTVLAIIFGAAIGAVVIRYSVAAALALAAAISVAATATLFRSVRNVDPL